MTPADVALVEQRLRSLSQMADLRPQRRLATKVDMSARGVTRRLRQVSELRRCCLAWGRWGGTRPRSGS
jgi:hypothetical protein